MEKYKKIKDLGDGSFGIVYKAINTETGEIVAIKKMKRKFNNWEECRNLREVKSLIQLTHPNIMLLKEVLKVKDELYLVFEYLSQNLFQTYEELKASGKTFTEDQIKSIVYQCAQALAYMHKNGFFHRDLKPENILVHRDKAKLADFGLAREIRSRPPYTDYVSTRWYRAPELLLKSTNYNSPVDIFALGCIMGELYMSHPLFMGSSELDQMYKICSTLGTPTRESWPDGYKLASQIGFNFPQFNPVSLSSMIPNASPEAINLLQRMLQFDPQKRITAAQMLQHPYFHNFSPEGILINDAEPLPVPSKKEPHNNNNNPSTITIEKSPKKEEKKVDLKTDSKMDSILEMPKSNYNPSNLYTTPVSKPTQGNRDLFSKPTGEVDLEALEERLKDTPTMDRTPTNLYNNVDGRTTPLNTSHLGNSNNTSGIHYGGYTPSFQTYGASSNNTSIIGGNNNGYIKSRKNIVNNPIDPFENKSSIGTFGTSNTNNILSGLYGGNLGSDLDYSKPHYGGAGTNMNIYDFKDTYQISSTNNVGGNNFFSSAKYQPSSNSPLKSNKYQADTYNTKVGTTTMTSNPFQPVTSKISNNYSTSTYGKNESDALSELLSKNLYDNYSNNSGRGGLGGYSNKTQITSGRNSNLGNYTTSTVNNSNYSNIYKPNLGNPSTNMLGHSPSFLTYNNTYQMPIEEGGFYGRHKF